MKSRHETLESYAKEKEKKLSVLKEFALMNFERINREKLIELLNDAYRIGHYVGHIRGEQYSSGLLESYQEQIRELEEKHAQYEF